MPYKNKADATAWKLRWAQAHPDKTNLRRYPKKCENCAQEFLSAHKNRKRFCSKECAAKGLSDTHLQDSLRLLDIYKSGEIPPMTEKRKQFTRQGYIKVQLHPKAWPHLTKNGYILEHRLVIELFLGRTLERLEIIHHRNAIKHDNRLENLQIVTHAEPNGIVKCPFCENRFEVH